MKLHLRIQSAVIALVLISTSLFVPIQVFADNANQLPQAVKDSVRQGSVWTDTTTQQMCSIPSANAASGNVFVIGDSYSEGLQQHKLADSLKTAGFDSVTFDASSGRSITGHGQTGNKLSAMDALDADKSTIEKAGTVLIILGTNNENYNDKIPAFMQKLGGINGSAKYYWMNTGNNFTSASTQQTINDAIAKNATQYKYQVIDWYSLYKTNPNGFMDMAATSQKGLHPSGAGYTAMIDLISKSMAGAATSTTTDGASAYGAASKEARVPKNVGEITQTPSKSTKDHDGNGKIVYQYLIGKGFSPVQAAGIMGNMQWETGGDGPHVGFVADDSSERAWPKGGYGIAQWTAGRRLEIVKSMNTAGIGFLYDTKYINGKTPSQYAGELLGFELDYFWYELNHAYKSTLTGIKASTTVDDSAKVFFDKYEGAQDWTLPNRIKNGKELLQQYSGLGGLIGTGGNTAGCSPGLLNGTAGQYGWDLSGDHAMVYYSQYDPKYASAWFGRTLEECGCGPTSMAMIISTLNHDSTVNPINIADYYGHHGGLAEGCGSAWNWTVLSNKYNLKYSDLGTDFGKAKDILAQGGLVLISVGKGEFTTKGHLMVVRKVTPDGGSFYIADPIGPKSTSPKNNTAYTIAQLKDPSFGDMRHMWGFTK